MATMSSHKSHLYSVELLQDELDKLKAESGKVHGLETDTERTFVEVRKVGELLSSSYVDWSTVGMILSVLTPLFTK